MLQPHVIKQHHDTSMALDAHHCPFEAISRCGEWDGSYVFRSFTKFKSKRETGDGEPDTVGVEIKNVDYFERTYDIRLKYPHLPGLQVISV